MKCEFLTDPLMFRHGKQMLAAMMLAAPIPIASRTAYRGDCDLLMTYGLGHPVRRPWCHQHRASGRHFISFDLGYWQRGNKAKDNRPMRVTIDHDHPQAWIKDQPGDRFDADGIALREEYDAKGPIILVGLGVKSNRMLRTHFNTWETGILPRIRDTYPEAKIVYRPKNEDGTSLPGTVRMAGMPIEQVLRGASLVVCRHSNVAVDACIAGVPVVCEDGAASLIYGKDLKHPAMPSRDERLHFLRNLAWWQWKPDEAAQCWSFLLNQIEEHDRVAA